MKNRLIVLTDINRGIEIDDIQSLVRLLLYSNEIDIEGLIATTSCFLKRGARQKHKNCILRVIAAYEKVKSNLDVHAEGYPSADYLRSISFCGIPVYGKACGNGFAEDRWSDNEGVRCILDAMQRQDERPLWIALWGGANTLAQAIWTASKQFPWTEFEKLISKLRIYAISDQDGAGLWLRREFGDKLFYVVSPCPPNTAKYFYRAAWPGISADNANHGYNGGRNKIIGFRGAPANISRKWLKENLVSRGIYGREYPYTHFLMEGDTPSYLSLIQNGLNEAEHPDFGGWGGRYIFRRPSFDEFLTQEKYPIWTNAEDTVKGVDGKMYKSAQATIWRWREEMQNDFAARMCWTQTNSYEKANHAPRIMLRVPNRIIAKSGDRVEMNADCIDPNGGELSYEWFHYQEAGSFGKTIRIENSAGKTAIVNVPKTDCSGSIHIILKVTNSGTPRLTSYARIIIEIQNKR